MTTSVLSLFDRAIGYGTRTLDVFVTSPSRIVETFVRSGFVERASNKGADRSINLSYLESMPLAMGVLAGMTHVFRDGLPKRQTYDVRELVFRDATGIGRARAFAVVYTAVMVLLYQQRLPLHSTVTLRFLVPTMPLVLFLVFQAPAFREALSEAFTTVLSSYALTVLVGGEVLAGVFVLSAFSVGEAMQLHALIALVVAGALAVWMLAGAVRNSSRSVRVGAVLIGVAFGVTTVFLVLSAFVHFPYGTFLLPISGELSALFN